MSIVSCVASRFKSLLLTILNLFKRILCLFHKRRRKPSGDVVNMETVVIDGGRSLNDSFNDPQMVSWNSWEDDTRREPATVEEHIEQYRKSLAKLRTSAAEEIAQEPDFFNDMTPDINTTNSLKLNLRTHLSPSANHQRVTFEVQEDFGSLMASPELGEILDDDEQPSSSGWEADEDLSQVLKQQRIDERKKKKEYGNLRGVSS